MQCLPIASHELVYLSASEESGAQQRCEEASTLVQAAYHKISCPLPKIEAIDFSETSVMGMNCFSIA